MNGSNPDERDPVKITLKIRETERTVHVLGSETIGQVKVKEFPDQRRVRFLCRGRELPDDMLVEAARPTGDSAGTDLIIHCVLPVSSQVEGAARDSSQNDADNEGPLAIESVSLLRILLGVACLLFWMLYYSLPDLFNPSSVATLVSLTVGYIAFQMVSFGRRSDHGIRSHAVDHRQGPEVVRM